MLYGAGVPDKETMKTAPQVGIASVWWEGNPCKYVIIRGIFGMLNGEPFEN
jgi:hypothetical protein